MKTIDIRYTPTPKQRLFHASVANEVLYGGAAGGGKSKAIVMDALMRCCRYPGTHAYLFRRTYPELEDTLIKEATASYPRELGKYNVSQKTYTMTNGSVIHFRHCAAVQDMYNYAGAEIQWLYMDELTSFEYDIYNFLKTRLRAKKELGVVPIVRCASNPGNIGHAWVKDYFVDAGPYMSLVTKVQESEVLGRRKKFTTQYIPAFATDNPYITEDYIFELERKPKALRDALLFGHWTAFEGQVFVEWRADQAHYGDRVGTHVIEPFPIPPEWPRYMGFDHGYTRPWAATWFAMSPDNRLYQYRELYGSTGPNKGDLKSPREIGQMIIAAEEPERSENIRVDRIADPAIFDRSRGDSVADIIRDCDGRFGGPTFRKGDNNRMNGLMQVHERLRMDGDGRPHVYVFKNCVNTIRTIPALPYSTTKVEDVDTDAEDHIFDTWKYVFQARPMPAEPVRRFHTRRRSPYDEPGEMEEYYAEYENRSRT